MSFKIVQTVETGQKVPSLSVVPAGWEENNVLYWPNTKKIKVLTELIKDANSVPQENWTRQTCLKKRENFSTYEAAENEIELMMNKTDTDNEQADDGRSSKRCKINYRKEINKPKKSVDLNHLICADNNINNNNEVVSISECIQTTQNLIQRASVTPVVTENSTMMAVPTIIEETILPEQNNIVIQQPATSFNKFTNGQLYNQNLVVLDTQTSNGLGDLSDMSFLQTMDNSDLKKIIESQNTIMNQQEKILKELAIHKNMLDYLCDKIGSDHKENEKEATSQNKNSTFNWSLPIDNSEALEQFEVDLLNHDFKDNVIQKMSVVCGTSGRMNSKNCCYALIDGFFKRELLMKYSWGGGSRNEEKSSFKVFKNILKTFHEIVSKADNSFSEMENENFFKSIIKNAKRRALIMPQRKSSGKKRPSNIKYQKTKKQNTAINLPDEDSDNELHQEDGDDGDDEEEKE